jgi:hypothetical protein
MVTRFNPARIRRIASRIAISTYRRLVSSLLSRLNLAAVLDSALASQIDKYSVHIAWEIDILPLDSHYKALNPIIGNVHLQRKMKDSNAENEFPNPFHSNIAFVLQGPIVTENQITLRIVNFYKARFPGATLILSTWEDTRKEDLKPFVKLAETEFIKLVLNQDPEIPGVFNINRQIVSTKSGLLVAQGLEEYAIKTRTDQVFTDSRFLNKLRVLLENGIINIDKDPRIVISSLNTFAFRLYGASDMFQFGRTKDLFSYWDQPLDNRTFEEAAKISLTLEDEAKKRISEVYLNTNYFTFRNKKSPNYSFEESLEFFAKSFVVADADSIGHRWLKYTNLSNRWRVPIFPNKFYELTHTDWVGIQSRTDDWLRYKHCIVSETFFSDK